jgi:hypothetical protein
VGGNFNDYVWRSEISKNRGAVISCPLSWQAPRRRWDSLKVSRRCCRKARPCGARPGGGVHRRVYRLRRKVEEKATGSYRSDLQLTAGKGLPPDILIHPSRAQVGPATARITAESIIDGKVAALAIWSPWWHCTIEELVQSVWQTVFGSILLSILSDNPCQAL